MDFKLALEIFKEKYAGHHSLRMVVPKVYMLQENLEGTFNLIDQGCRIPGREEWEVLQLIIQDFYDKATDEEINAANSTLNIHEYEVGSHQKKPKRKNKGFIYFLKADNGLVKIGKAKNLKQRLDHFTVKLPYKLVLIHSIESEDTDETEKYFHEKFQSKRKRGEWFDLSQSDIGEVKRYG